MDQIYRAITQKGWNIYQVRDNENINDFIPRGPVASLEPKKQYILMPPTRNPKNPQQVVENMQRMTQQGLGQ